MTDVLLLTPYQAGASAMGGAGFVDARLERALRLAGADFETVAVAGSRGAGVLAPDLRLQVQGSKPLLARTAARMVATGEPYNIAKFRIFRDAWAEGQERLRELARGRAVVASGWVPLLLCRDAGVAESVYIGHNLEWQVSETYAPLPLRLLRDATRSRRAESGLLAGAREALYLSATDAATANRLGLPGRPMPLGLSWAAPRPGGRKGTLGLLGSMSWPANRVAAELIVGELRDRLRALDAEVDIVLAGSGSEQFAGPGVTALGMVADLDDFYSRVDAVVVPRFEAGTTGVSVKMLEAWEAGVGVFADADTLRAVVPAVDASYLALDLDQLARQVAGWRPYLPTEDDLAAHSLGSLAAALASCLPVAVR